MSGQRPLLLPETPNNSPEVRHSLEHDHRRFAEQGLPPDLEGYLLDRYHLDVSGTYAGIRLKNPWGVASGQLSMKVGQVESAAEAGLAFVVLKTVIAEDASGDRSMAAWAIRESRMVVERIRSRSTGAEGWTVSWKGRGWWHSFEDYLQLIEEGVALADRADVLVIPSVKYHLPATENEPWRTGEYTTTTQRILDAYRRSGATRPMPIEKDFSPTLAGSDRSTRRRMIQEWLRQVPGLIRGSVGAASSLVGLKLFNSLEDDEFQLEMLREVHETEHADFLIYANRLFDPEREFEGHRGIAYGGPDLSDRNLRMLSSLRGRQARGEIERADLDLSGTGDIHSGRMAVEYALRGCSSFQIHTLFQLPQEEFAMTHGDRMARALHRLYFDPKDGLIAWLAHVGGRLGLSVEGVVRLRDVARSGRESAFQAGDLDA